MVKRMTVEQVIDFLKSYDGYNGFAFRGDDFTPAKSFRKSCYHGDECKPFQLDGVSAIGLTYIDDGTEIRKSISRASKYGKNVFLLTGAITNCHEWACDPYEVLVKNNQIVAIIDME